MQSVDFPFVLTAAPDGVFETGLLSFLVCLLALSLVLLLGFLFLRAPQGGRLVQRRLGCWTDPAACCCPRCRTRPSKFYWAARSATAAGSHGSYALFLVYGFLVAADRRIGEAFRRHW